MQKINPEATQEARCEVTRSSPVDTGATFESCGQTWSVSLESPSEGRRNDQGVMETELRSNGADLSGRRIDGSDSEESFRSALNEGSGNQDSTGESDADQSGEADILAMEESLIVSGQASETDEGSNGLKWGSTDLRFYGQPSSGERGGVSRRTGRPSSSSEELNSMDSPVSGAVPLRATSRSARVNSMTQGAGSVTDASEVVTGGIVAMRVTTEVDLSTPDDRKMTNLPESSWAMEFSDLGGRSGADELLDSGSFVSDGQNMRHPSGQAGVGSTLLREGGSSP